MVEREGWALLPSYRSVADLAVHATIAVAPLRATAGIQTKVLEAAAHGMPQVVSPQALQGVDPEFPAVLGRVSRPTRRSRRSPTGGAKRAPRSIRARLAPRLGALRCRRMDIVGPSGRGVTGRERWYYRLLGADGELRQVLADEQSVLDVGCADGRGSVLLTDRVAYGVDIHRPSLIAAADLGRRHGLVQADIRRLPYADNSFDVVVALDVVEHLEKRQAVELLAELERGPSSAVCLLTPSGFVAQAGTPEEPWQEHRCGFTASELKTLGYRVRGVGGARLLRGDYVWVRGG